MTRARVAFVTPVGRASVAGRRVAGVGVAVGVFGLLLLLGFPAVSAADDPAAPATASELDPAPVLQTLAVRDPVVARVNGRDIRWRDVMTSAGDLDITREEEAQALFPVLLTQTIDHELLAAAARQEGLDREAAVTADGDSDEDRALGRAYLQRELARATARDRLWAIYRARIDGAGDDIEIRARHILVKSRAAAADLIEALDGGADFAALAARHSIGPSAARGGDLGYFDPARMVAPFSRVALALRPGQYSKTPVETPFGWHVIQLIDLRQVGAPAFSELEAALKAEAEGGAREAIMGQLRANARVEILSEQLPEP